MKPEIHPEVRPVIFQDGVNGSLFRIPSCIATKQTITVAGREYPLVRVDVSSASHPFYTGTQRILDSAGRVEKFDTKFGAKISRLIRKKKA